MILNNELQIDAPVARVWALFDELEAVLPCMPGATYLGRSNEDELVAMKLKVGAITTNFEGTVRFVEKDQAARRVVIRGAGKDKGGKASASATIEAQLHVLSESSTRVSVKTDLALTGKLAQFGGGMIADISRRLIDQFAANLHQAVVQKSLRDGPTNDGKVRAETEPVSAHMDALPQAALASSPSPSGQRTSPRSAEAKPLDVGGFIGGWVWRQAARYVLVPGGMFALGWICARALA